jgi:hypothetical protein
MYEEKKTELKFVGRDSELAKLQKNLDSALDGNGSVIFVKG